MKISYDMIASLGGNCSAAIQLQDRGLRREAYHLDWVYAETEKSIEYLVKAFDNDFCDFALRENMEEFTDGLQKGVARYSYRDRLSGFCFIHHFNERIEDPVAYERQIAPVRRRVKRFLERLETSRRVLLVLTVRFPVEPALLVDLKNVLDLKYPGKKIELHVKEFNAKLSSPLSLCESWPEELGLSGGERYRCDSFPYSFTHASREWEFLDGLSLSGWIAPKPRGLAKLVYSIWKKSGKWLNGRGYGVKGVKFTS